MSYWIKHLRLWLKRWSNSRPHFGVDDWVALFILVVGVLGYVDGEIPNQPDWYIDIRSELIGIGVSVLIIANAGEYMSTVQEKKRLILQMGSPDNTFAIEAVRQLRAKGWLSDGSLSDAYLVNANLHGANLNDSILSNAILLSANLRGANLIGANLNDSALIGANLRDSNLRDADLSGAKLIGAKLIGANLRGAKLIGTDLEIVDLIRANLRGANLSNANLRNAKLKGVVDDPNKSYFAKYTSTTVWPDDFDPKAAGATLIE